jgi:hypothetical protein
MCNSNQQNKISAVFSNFVIKKMKKVIFLLTFVPLIISCSNNDKVVANLVEDKVATMSGHEVVRDLLIANDVDVEQLARIFKCSVPTINRVLDKETYLTDNALSEFRNLLVGVKVSGKDTFKENDAYYDSWIRALEYFLIKNFVFLVILGGVVAVSFNWFFIPKDFYGFLSLSAIPYFFILIIYLFSWILNLMWSYEQPVNLYIEKIDTIIETLL